MALLLSGEAKLQNLDFLQDIINDLKSILQQGLHCEGTPAKALVKNIKQDSRYYGYDKYSKTEMRNGWFLLSMTFKNIFRQIYETLS